MKRIWEVIRRGRRDICKSHEPSQEIPFDLVIEILTRLPAKSLMRFKSVSKLWSSLICSKYFTNRFLKFSSSSPHIYMWLGFQNNKYVLLSSSSSPNLDVSTLSCFVVDQDLTIPAMSKGYSVSHVFRGLMCFTNGPSALIYNTTTRQLVFLPNIEESNIIPLYPKSKNIRYHIVHDPIHDQYKVVCTASRPCDELREIGKILTEHWVLLLGRDESSPWRKISSTCPPHLPLRQGVTINGRIHYLAWARVPYHVLVTFDISSEKISMLEIPHFTPSLSKTSIIEYCGRVALLHHWDLARKGEMELWVLVEDAEKSKWSKKTLVLHPSQMNLVNISLRVQGTTSKGEVIFVPHNTALVGRTHKLITLPQNTNSFYVMLYSLQKNHMTQVEIIESSNRYVTKIWDVIGFDDTVNLMHL